MQTGAITGYIDVAQLVLYAFWIFFAGLIIYLRREDKREGYPLSSDRTDRTDRVLVQGFPAMPSPKTFKLAHGGTATAPNAAKDLREIHAEPVAPWPGAPLHPTGDPMQDGVGPAAYTQRAEGPDLTIDGLPKIVPLRAAAGFDIAGSDPDPRGMEVVGADRLTAGVVADAWVDRSENVIRYLEVAVSGTSRRALVPLTLAKVDGERRTVTVRSVLAKHFAVAPLLADPDTVSLTEEDRICAYFASGNLYAEPSRLGPWI